MVVDALRGRHHPVTGASLIRFGYASDPFRVHDYKVSARQVIRFGSELRSFRVRSRAFRGCRHTVAGARLVHFVYVTYLFRVAAELVSGGWSG